MTGDMDDIPALTLFHQRPQPCPGHAVLQHLRIYRPVHRGDARQQPYQRLALPAQAQRMPAFRQAEQAQHPQPVSDRRRITRVIILRGNHHQGHVLHGQRLAAGISQLQREIQQRPRLFRLSRHDDTDRRGARPDHGRADPAEHLYPDPVTDLSEDPAFVFDALVRGNTPAQALRQVGKRLELPARGIQPHLIISQQAAV